MEVIPIVLSALLWIVTIIWLIIDDRADRRRYGDKAVDRWNARNKIRW